MKTEKEFKEPEHADEESTSISNFTNNCIDMRQSIPKKEYDKKSHKAASRNTLRPQESRRGTFS